jgi:hypothetical protein
MLDITKRISMSHSYKTKMSMLEYVQVIPLSQSALLQENPTKNGYKFFYSLIRILLSSSKNSKKNLDSYYIVSSFGLFFFEK